MEMISIKKKTILFVAIVLLLFIVALLGTIYINQKQKLIGLEQEYYDNIKNTYQKVLERHNHFYTYRLKANINSKGVKDALVAFERDKLYDLIEGRWSVLKEENSHLELMHFHLPNGDSFLRIHKPEIYGDKIAKKRPMVAAMHEKKVPMYGFEAGVHMLAYRVFLPIFEEDRYLGALEIGAKPDHILHEMDYFARIKGALFVKQNSTIEHKENLKMMIGDFNLQYSTLEDDGLIKKLPKEYKLDGNIHFQSDGRSYAIYAFDLSDFTGATSAKTLFFHDITDMQDAFANTVKQLAIFLLGLLGLLLLVIHIGFEKILRTLDDAHLKLSESQSFMQSILDHSAHAIITTDTKGIITLFNRQAQTILGYKSEEMVGKHKPLIFHKKDEVESCAKILSAQFKKSIEPGFDVFTEKTHQGLENNEEWTYITKDKKEIPVSLYITALSDKSGSITGYLGIAEDISEKKYALQKIQETKRSLDEAQRIAHVGSWTLDMITNKLSWSDEIYRIFEIDSARFEPSYEEFINAIHLDDRERVKQIFEQSVKNKTPYEVTHRLKMKDGKIKYVNEHGYTRYDGDGNPVFAQGTVQDVTELKKVERNQKGYLKLIDQNIITSSTDLKGNITYASLAFCTISGYAKEELIGKNHNIIRHPDMDKHTYEHLWRSLLNNKPWQGEIKNLKKDGSSYWVDTTISPLFDEEGKKIGYTAIRQDVTDKKQIEKLAITDRLTGLYNRIHLDRVLKKEINESNRYGSKFSVIILDVDKFKSVNDTYGHQVGDSVLIETAETLQQNVRTTDTLGRWGGEEFLIIAPETDIEGARLLAEKLRVALEEFVFTTVGQKTASFGVSCYQSDESEKSLINRADKALYRAKESGRNRVEIENQEEEKIV